MSKPTANAEAVIDYITRIDKICASEFITIKDLINQLDITYSTFARARKLPMKCSMNTARKFKKFVERWEAKKQNLSVKD